MADAATTVADQIRRDADLLGTQPVTRAKAGLQLLHLLPAITWPQSRFWRYQLAQAADNLAADTYRWGAPVPRCTGEEMTLHIALRRAAITDTGLPETHALIAHDRDGLPDSWGGLAQYLFQDEDVLMLYDLPPEAIAATAGGVHLSPAQWFTTFTTPFPTPNR